MERPLQLAGHGSDAYACVRLHDFFSRKLFKFFLSRPVYRKSMLQISKDRDLAHYVSERTMAICMNVMTIVNRPMNDSVYALTSDNRDGGMILLMNINTPEPGHGFFAISSCQTTKDHIIVTTKTAMTLCTMTCIFEHDAANQSYSFYSRNVINESIPEIISAVDTQVSISRPIPIHAPAIMFNGEFDIQTP